jgi:hypothetical protein
LLRQVEKLVLFPEFQLVRVLVRIKLGGFSAFSTSYLNVALKLESGAKNYTSVCKSIFFY